MNIHEAIQARRAINFFDPKREIPENTLTEIIELAGLAPSSYNLQPWEVVLIQKPGDKKKLRGAAFGQAKVEEASAVMIILANTAALEETLEANLHDKIDQGYLKPEDIEKARQGPFNMYGEKESEKRKLFAVKNAAFFAMNIMLVAQGFGIETHPMDGFNEEKVRNGFSIPEDRLVPLLVTLGYPAPGLELLPRPRRRNVSEYLKKDRYR